MSQNTVNRDIPGITNPQFWDIFQKFIKLIISEAFYSPTDFINHELQSNVPGLIPYLWELALRRLLSALKKEAFLKREFTLIKSMGQKGQQCFIFVAACMKCVLHFLTSFCVTLCFAMRKFFTIVHFRHHRVIVAQQLVFTASSVIKPASFPCIIDAVLP